MRPSSHHGRSPVAAAAAGERRVPRGEIADLHEVRRIGVGPDYEVVLVAGRRAWLVSRRDGARLSPVWTRSRGDDLRMFTGIVEDLATRRLVFFT